MARIRTIKPEFWQDEKLSKLTVGARLLFMGLISLADDEGRLRGDPKLIRSQLFPYEAKLENQVEVWLENVIEGGFVVRYRNAGETFLWLPHFLRHQKINRPSKSRLPDPPEASCQLSEPSVSIPVASVTDPREGSLTEVEVDLGSRNGRGMEGEKPAASVQVLEVFDYWAMKLGHSKAKLDPDRMKLIVTRLKEAGGPEDLKLAIDGVLVDIEAWPDRRRFDGVERIFESRASVEKYMDLALKGNPKPKVDVRKGFLRAEDQDWANVPMGKVS